jgi:hypothetical protein
VLGHSATCHFAQLSFCQHDILLFWTKCGARSFCHLSFCPIVILSFQLLFLTMVKVFWEPKIIVVGHSATCHFAQLSFCHCDNGESIFGNQKL